MDKLIYEGFRPLVDRLIICSPTFHQRAFDKIRHLVKESDIHKHVDKDTFARIFKELEFCSQYNKQRTLIYVDDCAGTKGVYRVKF